MTDERTTDHRRLISRILAGSGPDVGIDEDLMDVVHRRSDRYVPRTPAADGSESILIDHEIWVDRTMGHRVSSTPFPFTSDIAHALSFLGSMVPEASYVFAKGQTKPTEPAFGLRIEVADRIVAETEHDDPRRCILAATLRALAPPPVEDDLECHPSDESVEETWRDLALQFDGHRMDALSWLRAMVADPAGATEGAVAFLAAPPLPGEMVLATRLRCTGPSTDAEPSWMARCVQCGRVVDTRERDEGGDDHGCEASDGRWACSIECYEKEVGDASLVVSAPGEADLRRELGGLRAMCDRIARRLDENGLIVEKGVESTARTAQRFRNTAGALRAVVGAAPKSAGRDVGRRIES